MFNDRLKAKREERGLTQAELARRVGIGRDLYNKYERAGTRPSQETLVSLASELDTTVDFLIGKEDSDKAHTDGLRGDIGLDALEFALFGEVRELDDEDKEELLRDARRMRELRELRRQQKGV